MTAPGPLTAQAIKKAISFLATVDHVAGHGAR